MNATMNPTPARAEMTKHAATVRSARFSAFVPGTGNRLRRCTRYTSSERAAVIIACCVFIPRSSSSLGRSDSDPLIGLPALRTSAHRAACWAPVLRARSRLGSDPQDNDHHGTDAKDPDDQA